MTLLSFKLAYRHMRASFGRVVLAIVAIALGVALVVAMRLMSDAVLASFFDDLDAMVGRAALVVTAPDGVPFDETVAQTLKDEVPGIDLAVPVVTSLAFPDDHSGESLTVHAIDLGDQATVEVYHTGSARNIVTEEPRSNFLYKTDSIALAREFAERRDLEINDTLDLVTPMGVRSFTVRALLEPEGMARTLRGRIAVMDLLSAEEYFTGPGKINQIDLIVARGQEKVIKAAVETKLPHGLKVEEPEARKDMVRRATRSFQALLTVFSLLAVVAGFLVCFSRLATIFEARTWEVGLLRAVGLSRLTVFTELLKESLLLGLLGTALGIPLGIVIGRYGLPLVAESFAESSPFLVETFRGS